MGEKNRISRDVFDKYLIQLKKSYQLADWRTNRSYYRFFVFSVSVSALIGIVILLTVGREDFVAKAENHIIAVKPEEEQCRWRRERTLFILLEKGNSRLFSEKTLCEKKIEKQIKNLAEKSSNNRELDQTIREITDGYPLEMMAPAIARFDRDVAALIVGIAKKESNWGKHVPRDANGVDCFNYWGWKGAGSRGMAMGHGCFGSSDEAVAAVGNRLTELVAIKQTSEPKNLTVWKCGSSCAMDNQANVAKWVSDIDIYYKQIAKN